jgi:hypothetical protein
VLGIHAGATIRRTEILERRCSDLLQRRAYLREPEQADRGEQIRGLGKKPEDLGSVREHDALLAGPRCREQTVQES